MFCRFCGKNIQDDSEYCPYCGKFLQVEIAPVHQPKSQTKFNLDKINLSTLDTIASYFFYIGIIVFLILLFKMAPGIGSGAIISYLAIASIVIILSVIVHKIRNKKYTKQRQLIAIIWGLSLLISSISLRIVYEAKVDGITANIPSSGMVCVRAHLDKEFYSYYSEGRIKNPYAYITVDGERHEGGGDFLIEIGKEYTLVVGAGHEGGTSTGYDFGNTSIAITLTPENLQNSFTTTQEVPMHGGYAKVTITLQRICTFWEVVFS